jgi:hypothetical protein
VRSLWVRAPPPDRNSLFANCSTRHLAIVAHELESCRYPIARRLVADRCNQGFGKLYGPVLDQCGEFRRWCFVHFPRPRHLASAQFSTKSCPFPNFGSVKSFRQLAQIPLRGAMPSMPKSRPGPKGDKTQLNERARFQADIGNHISDLPTLVPPFGGVNASRRKRGTRRLRLKMRLPGCTTIGLRLVPPYDTSTALSDRQLIRFVPSPRKPFRPPSRRRGRRWRTPWPTWAIAILLMRRVSFFGRCMNGPISATQPLFRHSVWRPARYSGWHGRSILTCRRS